MTDPIEHWFGPDRQIGYRSGEREAFILRIGTIEHYYYKISEFVRLLRLMRRACDFRAGFKARERK
jgi:hypothetical protein